MSLMFPTLALRFFTSAAAAAKSLHSCPTLCDPRDCSLSGFSVHGILQARTLEWVAISFSNAWKWKVKVKSLSCAQLFATPWTAAYQAPPSMGFSRQGYWSGVPLPSPSLPLTFLCLPLGLLTLLMKSVTDTIDPYYSQLNKHLVSASKILKSGCVQIEVTFFYWEEQRKLMMSKENTLVSII